MRKGLLALLTAVTLVFGAIPSHALHSLEKYISAKSLASPGLLIMNPNDGKVIAENSPESLRVPASVLKLISTSAVLHFVGPDKTYSTTIYSTDQASTFIIKGTLDPWLTSNMTRAKKNGQIFLPALISKANTENKKKITIYYTGIFEKDKYDLNINLKSKGIRATFKKIEGDAVSGKAKDEVASFTSLPISEMVKFAIMWSDNTLANRLGNSAARKIGYETTPAGLTKTFKLALEEIGVDATGLKVEDGSGLSKANRVSAKTLVELLMKIRNNSRYESIYDGMPVGGLTGTLQKRFVETAPQAIGHVHAKTGWVNRSVTMAGYVDDGETEFAFAILADGITPTLGARNRARASMDRLLGVIVKGNH
ncbi:MAG: D-alanyl-D-alanine carboxypeptidase [Actinomycetales bacterium]|nr:D-alanyl-D-alanine carboxypeptidase [Actinomycetales bacterium]